jgi:hypothetical protein
MDLIGTKSFTVKEWFAVCDNPRQRDTEKRAVKASRDHLKKPSPAHTFVHVCRLPNGRYVKLDGHTRALLWSDGRLEAPNEIIACVYSIASMQEAEELYDHFDNQSAVETGNDRLSGAFRKSEIVPTSALLKTGGILSAFNLMRPGKPRDAIYGIVEQWKPELLILDTITATPTAVPAALLCGCLLTIRKHGERAADFWRLYGAGGGTRIDGASCGVDELTRFVADARARKYLGANRAMSTNQCGRAISCCEAWISGRRFTTGSKPTNLGTYMAEIESRGYIAGVRGAAFKLRDIEGGAND